MPPGHAHNGSDSNPTKPDHDHTPARHAKPPPDLRIALVDWDEGTHLSVQKMLTTHAPGWRLHSYFDVVPAMRDIPAARPHVVLMDLCLPGNSGIHHARKLKSIPPELPIVMFTARSDSDSMLLATYTVHRHRSSVYKKYAAHSRKELLEKFAGLPKTKAR